jgi:hypothetical protein
MATKRTVTYVPASNTDPVVSFKDWIKKLPDNEKLLVNDAITKQQQVMSSSIVTGEDNVSILEKSFEAHPDWLGYFRRFLSETKQTIKIDDEEI